LKEEEVAKRVLIEKEKEKLIREHEDLLKSFFTKGYIKSVGSLNSNNSFSNNLNYLPSQNQSQSFSGSINQFK